MSLREQGSRGTVLMTENLSSRYRIEVRRMRRKPRATSSAECDVEVGRLELTQINIDRERKKALQ